MKISCSCLNPFSVDFRTSVKNFKQLSLEKKVAVVAIATFAALATVFMLGLGAVPTFRWMVQRLYKEKIEGQEPVVPKEKLSSKEKDSISRILAIPLGDKTDWTKVDLTNGSALQQFWEAWESDSIWSSVFDYGEHPQKSWADISSLFELKVLSTLHIRSLRHAMDYDNAQVGMANDKTLKQWQDKLRELAPNFIGN